MTAWRCKHIFNYSRISSVSTLFAYLPLGLLHVMSASGIDDAVTALATWHVFVTIRSRISASCLLVYGISADDYTYVNVILHGLIFSVTQ
jgi:hypothetical protein